LPVIFYGCDTWSVTLRGEHRLRVSDNGALRKALGPEREKVAGYQRKLHYEELHDVHSSLNIIRRFKSKEDEMGETCCTYGEEKRCMRDFGGET
jgi:hypothetical protein